MDFAGNSKKSGRSARNKKQFNRVGHNLQFYKIPPTGEISLQEFEEYAIDRLKGALKLAKFTIEIINENLSNSP